jgi:hypothetical protein
MGLEYWNIKDKPDEDYLGWSIFLESAGEIGQTVGMFPTRARAVKEDMELIFLAKRTSHKPSPFRAESSGGQF